MSKLKYGERLKVYFRISLIKLYEIKNYKRQFKATDIRKSIRFRTAFSDVIQKDNNCLSVDRLRAL